MKKCVSWLMILTLLCLVLMLIILPISTRATEEEESVYRVVIDDQADLLTEAEEEELRSVMEQVLPYGNAAFVSVNVNAATPERLAVSKFLEFFGDTSGVLFLIDMDNRYIQLIADGAVYKTVTGARCSEIVDSIYTYASNGQYAACAAGAFEQVVKLLENEPAVRPGDRTYYGYSMQFAGMEIVIADYLDFPNASKDYCLILHADGTGTLDMADGEITELIWTETELLSHGVGFSYTMEGDHLILNLGNVSMTFIPAAELEALLGTQDTDPLTDVREFIYEIRATD